MSNRGKLTVIESAEIQAEVKRLYDDPIIRAMEAELPPETNIQEWAFIRAASEEFHKRGGNAKTIGGPARAIQAVRNAAIPPDYVFTPGNSDEFPTTLPREVNKMTDETPIEETPEPTPAKPKRKPAKPKQNLQPLSRPVKLTLPGARAAQAAQSRYVHIIQAGEQDCMCGLKASEWKNVRELPEDTKINCPVCAKAQKAAQKA